MVKKCRMLDFSIIGALESEMIIEVQKRLKYKNGKIVLTEEEQMSMDTLDLLESLGYPMDEFGTYLYKDVIMSIRQKLGNIQTRSDIKDSKNILEEAKSPYSQLYFNLARNERDIGVKEYHRIMLNSFKKIDYEKASSEVLYKVYGNIPFGMDYGENAFTLATFLNRQKSKTLCRKLTNLSSV